MRIDYKRFILSMVAIVVFQIVLQNVLMQLVSSAAAFVILYNLILAYFIVWLNLPSGYRIAAFKSPKTHMYVAILFAVFVLIYLF